MSWNFKIKLIQGVCYVGGPLIIILYFNLPYLLAALLSSNIIVNLGIGLSYHRMYAHQSWKPKNKFIEYTLYFFGIVTCMGPAINWVGTHRLHHEAADTDKDPHSPVNKPLWTKIKYWFNYWESHDVKVNSIKDMIRNPVHKFVFRNYFKILFAYAGTLLLIDLDLFLYGFIVTTMFSLHFVSWITVGAHLFGHKVHNTKDASLNTKLMGLILWGEGYHNNHHYKPSSANFGLGEFDLGYLIIRKLAV